MSDFSPSIAPYFRDDLGFGLFDGMLIHTDPLVAQRYDKVMPLWPEEHLVTASVLKSLDLKGKSVLDIGCGSGVFSVLCAREGAAVLAVDCNVRALSFTLANSSANGIKTATGPTTELEDGGIHVLHEFLDSGSIHRLNSYSERRGFDIVLITPPYTPGFPYLIPAMHASAGLDGQTGFLQLIGPAVELLSPSGALVCNHMSTVKRNGAVLATEKIRQTMRDRFGEKCLLTTHFCLDRPRYEIRRFLNNQYMTLNKILEWSDPVLGVELRKYIARQTDLNSSLELATYVASVERDVAKMSQGAHDTKRYARQFSRTWKSRELLHSQIVETAVPAATLPISGISSNTSSFGTSLPENPHNRSNRNFRRDVQNRVGLDLGMLDVSSKSATVNFDLIVIDAAPLSDHVLGQAELNNEMTIWLSRRLREQSQVDGVYFGEQLVERWQNNTRKQQDSRIGPFMHPWFTGAISESEWTLMHQTTRLRTGSGAIEHSMLGDADLFLEWQRQVKIGNGQEASEDYEVSFEDGIGVHGKRLGDLDVQAAVTYVTDVLRDTRLDVLWNEIVKSFELSRDEAKILADVRRRIREDEENSVAKAFLEETVPHGSKSAALLTYLLRQDAQFCHRRMHERLEKGITPLLPENLDLAWSTLHGMPLRIRSLAERRANGLPSQYRGGVWIFFASLEANPLGYHVPLENESLKISKSVWLNYIDRFGMQSAEHLFSKTLHDTNHQISAALLNMEELTLRDTVEPSILRMQARLVRMLFKLHAVGGSGYEGREKMGMSILDVVETAVWAGQRRLHEEFRRLRYEECDTENVLVKSYMKLKIQCTNSHFDIAASLKEMIDFEIGAPPEELASVVEEPRFCVMFYSGLRQAYFHAFRYKLYSGKASKVAVSFRNCEKQLAVTIINSGDRDRFVGSKDAYLLKHYADRFGLTTTDGPSPAIQGNIWVLKMKFAVAGG